jgi:hypothetical protein
VFGGVAEWLKASDCKSDLLEYEGSNPSPSTKNSSFIKLGLKACKDRLVGKLRV